MLFPFGVSVLIETTNPVIWTVQRRLIVEERFWGAARRSQPSSGPRVVCAE
jgi:hypothetical protein